jgi:CRISPR system Cascade subunit CasA
MPSLEPKHFNLVEDPWIPIVETGLVSLRQIFSEPKHRAIGGNPLERIALTKLILAIAQAANTPEDEYQWASLSIDDLARSCLDYVNYWRDNFYLYGDRPFLQMPAIKAAHLQSYGAIIPEVATGNTTVLTQWQRERNISDSDRALLLVQLMGCALGGKKTDNSVVLSTGYSGKSNDKGNPSTGTYGPFIGFKGFLHSFMLGRSVQETIYLNLLTKAEIAGLAVFTHGVGIPPWEKMPAGEDCQTARSLTSSLMGRLVPLSRFCLLTQEGLHYSEGIAYPGYAEGGIDPSVSIDRTGKAPRALWASPEKRPWRVLTSLLSFLAQTQSSGFECYQLRFGVKKAISCASDLGIWCGGLAVSINAGEQYISGSDDFVSSEIMLPPEVTGQVWFANFQGEMDKLERMSKTLYQCTSLYFTRGAGDSGGRNVAAGRDAESRGAQATHLFWRLAETYAPNLIEACAKPELLPEIRRTFVDLAWKAYDSQCARETARQLDAWARYRPKLEQYLRNNSV